MRVFVAVFLAVLAAPAAAQEPQNEPVAVAPGLLSFDPPPAKRDVKKHERDLVSALRNLRGHLKDWSEDPVAVCRSLRLGADTIAILRVRFR